MKLPSSLTIRDLRELKPQFVADIGTPELCIDAGAIEAIDTAGLQLLLALCAARRSNGGTTSINNPSSALREAAQALGLAPALGLAAS